MTNPQQKSAKISIFALVGLICVWLLMSSLVGAVAIVPEGAVITVASQIFEQEAVKNIRLPDNKQLSPQYEEYPAHSSVGVVDVEETKMPLAPAPELTPDKTKPIYEVYKNGYKVEAPAEWQWYIREKAQEYGFDEQVIMSMITCESTWQPRVVGGRDFSFGLTQQTTHWVNNTVLKNGDFYIEDWDGTNKAEWLKDPYHNINNLIAIWRYAVASYNIDLSIDDGYVKLLYWHNTGQDPRNVTSWGYATKIFGFKQELVAL